MKPNRAVTVDKLRKMCIAALCQYIDVKGIATTDKVQYAKQMACRSAKKEDFNRLNAAELSGVIGYFNKERMTIERARGIYGRGKNKIVMLTNKIAEA